MRVLLVKSFPHPTSVGELAKGLRRLGHEVHLLLPPGRPDYADLREAGVTVHLVEMFPNGAGEGTLRVSLRFGRLLRRHAFDVIHLNLARARLCGRLASFARRKAAVVSTIRGFEARYEKWTNWMDDRTVAVSSAVKRYLVSEGVPEARLVTIPNGIDVAEVDRQARGRGWLQRELGLEPGTRLVGMVAFFRSHALKGHKVFLDAARLVASAEPGVRFVLVGSDLSTTGYTRGYFERYAEGLGLGDVVHFLGGRDDVVPIMSSLDLHVLPSYREGCPMVVLEAMATGTPTIASRIESIAEIIVDGDSGVLVEPGDHEALAAQTIRLLRDRAAAETIARSARRRVETAFTVSEMARRYEALYHQLAWGA